MEKKLPFNSDRLSDQAKIWISAARPRTFTASAVPVLVGTVLAKESEHALNGSIALMALLFSILIQIGMHFVNDALDFKKGADNELRIGFKRATQSGLLTSKQVLMGGFLCFALAFLLGIVLMLHGGLPLILVVTLSILLGYLYTGGPFPIAYNGLGDLFVFIFYGLVATMTAYYLQTYSMNLSVILAGIQVGGLATAIMATNNLRDINSDTKANKKTLAVLFGINFARWEIMIVSFFPFLIGLYWVYFNHPMAGFLPLFMFPLAYNTVKLIWKHPPSAFYNQLFVRIAFIHLMFGLLFTLGYLLE